MKVETFIRKYAEKHTKPDQKFCPIFGIRWNGHNKELGSYFKIYVPNTGNVYVNNSYIPELNHLSQWHRTLSPRSYGYIGVCAKNIGHDVIEVAYVEMKNGGRGKEGEIREWTYGSGYYRVPAPQYRILIDRKTMLPYDINGERLWKDDDGKFYNRCLVKTLSSICNYGRMEPQHLAETLEEFCGVKEAAIGWQNSIVSVDKMWALANFIKKEKERPVSDLSAKLSDYQLPERHYTNSNVIEFDIIDDTYAVYRIFHCNETYSAETRGYIYKGEAKETLRVFVSNKGKVSILKRNTITGTWNITSARLESLVYIKAAQYIGFEKIKEWNPLKWIEDVVEYTRPGNQGYYTNRDTDVISSVIKILRHPIIERLYKAGYVNLAKNLMLHDVNAWLRQMFFMDKVNERTKSINKMLGVNKYILETINDEDINTIIIRQLKRVFGTEHISFLSKETVDLYMNGLRASGTDWESIVGKTYYWWESRNNKWCNTPTEEERHLIEKLYRLEQKEPGVARAYKDAKSIYRRLNNKPEIDWKDFRHAEDIINLHDNLQALIDVEDAERRRFREMADAERKEELEKKFKKLQEDRVAKFECIGEKYSMLVPHDLAEITTEGQSLHHCVGGYLDHHAQGQTNIIFLRQNMMPTVPFYTIEVDNNGNVIQIHGLYNRWLGNDPDAISFVWKWIKDRGFRCEKYKLLNTGTGYVQGKDEVSETYLVA